MEREAAKAGTVNRPSRLKGLDEMRIPRRTLRQRYFAVRATIFYSKRLAWLRGGFKGLVVVVLLVVSARLLGYPVEKWLKSMLHAFGVGR